MSRNFKKYRKYYLAILFAVVLVLLPTHPANAGCNILTGVNGCILEGASYFVYLIFAIVGKGIAALAGTLQWIINLPVYPADGQRIAVIDKSWEIMRNFANMFFIVALIMMAFATIFDVLPGAAKYNARALFGRFLLTALLINFSLVLGIMVIQGTQVLSNTFLTAIGDMSGRLGQELNPSLLFPKTGATTTAAQAVDQGLFGMFIQLVFALVLAFTFLFSLLTATIFAFVRIPIIWALLVVSPIAWILNIFPAGQGTFKKWWSAFIGWNMFLPIFLFFLYFGLYFLQGQDAVVKAIAGSSSTGTILGDITTSFTFQMLFMYVMAGIFLIGGTIVAMKASMFSGTGVVGVAGWARGRAARWTGIAGWQKASKQKWEEMQQEGYGVGKYRVGGEKAFEAEALRRARFLGTKGALGKGVEAEKEKQKPYAHDIGKLQDLSTTGSKEQRLAARTRLIELGAYDKKEVMTTYQMAGGDRSEEANKIINSVDYSKYSKEDREWFNKNLTNLEARKKNAMAMIEKDKLELDKVIEMAMNNFAPGEVMDFLEKGRKKNFLAIAQAKARLRTPGAGTEDEEIKKAFKKITDDEAIELINDLDYSSRDPNVRAEINRIESNLLDALHTNPKRLETIATKASGKTHTKVRAMARVARKPQVKELTTKKNRVLVQVNQARTDLSSIEQNIIALQNNTVLQNQPTSSAAAQLRQQIAQLERQHTAKENEVKSLSEKIDKYDEKIANTRSGASTTP